jgi:hypothetical protein
MVLEKIVYTAHASAAGGRQETAKSDNGKLDGARQKTDNEAR